MRYLPILFGAIILSIGCNNNQDNLQIEIPNAKSASLETGQIPSENPVYSMTHNYTQYTWKDLDAYYRGPMQQESDKPYFKNLKNLAFNTMVKVFRLPEQAPPGIIAYYAEEQAAMPYTPFVAEFIQCLDKLDGYWPKEKIQKVSLDRYEKTRSYYLDNKVWKPRWENEKSRYEALLSIGTEK